jgi:hypothetical protein
MNQPTKTETMNGGTNLEVTLRDGTKATIFVRQLPARKMNDLMLAQENEAAIIDLACTLNGKAVLPDFVDSLSEESHVAAIAEIERINSDFFIKWGQRQKIRAGNLAAKLQLEVK